VQLESGRQEWGETETLLYCCIAETETLQCIVAMKPRHYCIVAQKLMGNVRACLT